MKSNCLTKVILKYILLLVVCLVSLNYNVSASFGDTGEQTNYETGKTYIIPMEFYSCFGAWDSKDLVGKYSNRRIQLQDNALVKKLESGKFEVTIYYHGYHVVDMIQILSDSSLEELKKTYGEPAEIPMGTFNAPEDYKDPEEAESLINRGLISQEADKYYRKDISFTLADEDLDTGKMVFTMDRLSDGIYIKDCYTPNAEPISIQQIRFSQAKSEVFQTYGKGSYELGYGWYNYGEVDIGDCARKYTDSSIAMYSKLNELFEKTVPVNVESNGKLKAELKIKNPGDIHTIEIALKKNINFNELPKYQKKALFQEFAGMEYNQIWSSDTGGDTISLNFSDMSQGYYLRIMTNEIEEFNKGKPASLQKGWYAFLKLETTPGKETEDLILSSGEAKLKTTSDVIPENSLFAFQKVGRDETPIYADKHTADSFRGFAKDENSCLIYESSLKNGEAAVEKLNGSVTLEVPIPENFNLDTTVPAIFCSDHNSLLDGMDQYIDKETHCFRYTTSQISQINATYVFFDRGDVLSRSGMEQLAEGFYQVDLTIAHARMPYRPSMANPSIADNKGILEVKNGDGGKKTFQVYYEMEPVYVSTLTGYMTGEAACNGSDRNDTTPVTVLEYYAKDDGSLAYDDWAEEYGFQYFKRIMVPLKTPMDDGTYLLKFAVPAMDTNTGDGSGIQYAPLRIRNPQKVAENSLAGYDKTVLKAVIDRSNSYLKTLSTDSETYQTLNTAVQAAQSVYGSNPDENSIIRETGTLQEALKKAGGEPEEDKLSDGTYELPFTVLESSQSGDSEFKNYFDTSKAILKVQSGKMTVTLNRKKQGEDYVNFFQYDNGGSEAVDGTIVKGGDGLPVGYTFTRAYTEEPVEIKLKSVTIDNFPHVCYLSLDFSGAARKQASEEDISELNKKIQEAKKRKEEDYTKNSFADLKTAIEKAETYLSVEEPSYDIISGQTTVLIHEMDNLVSLVDLKAVIAKAAEYKNTDYTEESYQVLAAQIVNARNILVKADATKEEVGSQREKLQKAIDDLVPAGSTPNVEPLEDGIYEIPMNLYNHGTEEENSNSKYFKSSEITVSGEGKQMTVKLAMQSDDGNKWLEKLNYHTAEEVKQIKDTETDGEGHITSFQFDLAYTEEPIWLEIDKTYYKVDLDLVLDFENAVKKETPSTGLEDGTYEIPMNLYNHGTEEENSNSKYFKSSEITVSGEGKQMTVKLAMQGDDGSKWLMKLNYHTAEEVKEIKDTETDGEGHITSFQFDLAYTEEPIWLEIDKTYYKVDLDLVLDFGNAVKKVTANKNKLNILLASSSGVFFEQDSYTWGTYQTFHEAFTKANTVNAEEESTQEEVDAAVQMLQAAYDGLEKRGDVTKLKESIANAEKAVGDNAGQYSSESVESLKSVLDQVKEKLEKDSDNMNQTEVDKQKNLLDKAYEALEENQIPALKKELLDLLDSCGGEIYEEDYTQDSWEEFEKARKAAENIDEETASEEAYQTAIDNLKQAINGLEEAEEPGDTSEILEELKQLVEELEDFVEDSAFDLESSSYNAYMAAVHMADTEDAYALSKDQIQAQIDWLNAEKEALVYSEDLEATESLSLEELLVESKFEETIPEETQVPIEEDITPEETEAEPEGETTPEETEAEPEGETTSEETEAEPEGETTLEETEAEPEEETTPEETEAEPEGEMTPEEMEAETEEETIPEETEIETEGTTESKESNEPEKAEKQLNVSMVQSEFSKLRLTASLATPNHSSKPAEITAEDKEVSRLRSYVNSIKSTSSKIKDGTYTVNYALWKYDLNSASMGNPSFVKPGTLIMKDGNPTIYLKLQGMNYSGLYGHLKSINKMKNVTDTQDGIDYEKESPTYIRYSQESDAYGKAGDYPSIVGFPITLYQEYTGVEVDVPVMGDIGRVQVARLRIYWDSLEYKNSSTDIEDNGGEEPDTEKLEKAIKDFDTLTKDSANYISNSYYALLKSVKAGEKLKGLSNSTQEMVDYRTSAIRAGMKALIPAASEEERKELESTIQKTEETYKISDYTEESFQALTQALIQANMDVKEADVTAGILTRDRKDIKDAVRKLVKDTSGEIKKSELVQWIHKAKECIRSGSYTASSTEELTEVLLKAIEINASPYAAQDQIDEQTAALKSAIDQLDAAADKSELERLLEEAKEISSQKYTKESYDSLVNAIAAGTFIKKDKNATSAQIRQASQDLKAALKGLKKAGDQSNGEDLSGANQTLLGYINMGASYSSSNYTSSSYQALATALSNARMIYAGTTASAVERLAAADTLKMAINGLRRESGSENKEDDGYYKVKVRLWHATMNKASMGDDAISPTAYVQIDDGDVTMRLVSKKMSVSGITAHLHDFWIYDNGDYDSADLVSTEGNKWIYEFKLPEDDEKYYKCKVDPKVEVMGDDPVKARLKVTWSSLKEIDEEDWDDLVGDVSDDDQDDESVSSSYRTAGELSDASTGIKVKGSTGGPGIVLKATHKKEGSEYNLAKTALNNAAKQFVLYDIKLQAGSQNIQPKSYITLRIPIPAGYDKNKLILYRIHDDGSSEELSGKVNENYYEANVNHFSLYALAESNQEKGTAFHQKNTTAVHKKTGSSPKSVSGKTIKNRIKNKENTKEAVQTINGRNIPYTGDKTPVKGLMGLGTFSFVLYLGMAYKGRKRD